MHTITWKRGRGQWTANVGKVACTILPPNKSDPLPYYWWEIAGPVPFSGRGGGSTLKIAQRMVADRIAECEKKALRMPENQTNISLAEVGI